MVFGLSASTLSKHKVANRILSSRFVITADLTDALAQVFEVRAKTALVYAVLAFVASLGAMEIGSLGRSLLGWPVDSEETANQFDAGSFALPTRSVSSCIFLCLGLFKGDYGLISSHCTRYKMSQKSVDFKFCCFDHS